MKHANTRSAALTVLSITLTLGLAACDRPTVVAVPAPTVVVPGPTGPAGAPGSTGNTGMQGSQGTQGATGYQGAEGQKGDVGKAGSNTTVIVTPPAPADTPK